MLDSTTKLDIGAVGARGPHFAVGPTPMPLVSIIVPVYNERATIAAVVERLSAVPLAKEIILVDDASTDGTRAEIVTLAQRFPVRTCFKAMNEGKGAAIRTGLALCTGNVIVIQDADLEYDPREIPRLVDAIERDLADVVYGSRFLTAAGQPHGGVRRLHRFVNGCLTWLSNRCTGLALTDMETCYKAIRREALADVVIEQNRFGFEPEITAKLARKKLRFVEVPVAYSPRGYRDGKKIMPIDLLKAVYAIVRYAVAR